MDTVFLVYKTDSWHSYNSRDIIGIATHKDLAIDIVLMKASKEGEATSIKEQLFNLDHILQTQGYAGEGEFQIEQMELNTLL